MTIDEGRVGEPELAPDVPTPDASPEPPSQAEEGHIVQVDGREAAAQAIREMTAAAAETEPEAPVPAEPEQTEQEQEQEAEAAPDDAPGDETDERGQKHKPSILREARRRQKAAQREAALARQERAQAQQMLEEARQLSSQLAEHRQFQQQFKRDPWGAMIAQTGMSREQLLAQQLDGAAGDVPPAVQSQLEEMRQQLAAERKAREEREQQMQQLATRQQFESLVQQDIDVFEKRLENGGGETYPHAAAMPKGKRQAKARELVAQAKAEMDRIGDPNFYTRADIMDALEEWSQGEISQWVDNPLLRAKYGLTAEQAAQGDGLAATGKKPAPNPARAAIPRGVSATDSATPPIQSQMTDAERREAAAAAVRDMLKSG